LDQEEFTKFSLRIVRREHFLECILEGKVESLGREVSDDIGKISSPESEQSLLLIDSNEAVGDSGVTRDFTTSDPRVGILSLDDKLDSLDWGSDSLCDGTTDTTKGEVNKEVGDGLF